jgi:hypothetical protein
MLLVCGVLAALMPSGKGTGVQSVGKLAYMM